MASDEMASGRRPSRPEWTEEDLAREAALLQNHVTALKQRIQTHVGKHLKEECAAQEVSKEWINAAYHALSAELSPEDVQHEADLEQARHQAIASLCRAIGKEGPKLLPTEEEIDAHAQELAQCVVGNWLSLIKLAQRPAARAGKTLVLNSEWLPDERSAADLSRGLSAFAADPAFVLQTWKDYLAKQTNEGRPFPIAADLHLAVKGKERRVLTGAAKAVGVEEPALDTIDALIIELLGTFKGSHQTTADVDAALELEADVSAGLVAAAEIHTGSATSPVKSVGWGAKEPGLCQEVAELLLNECSEFLQLERPSDSRHSFQFVGGVHGRTKQALLKKREALDRRFAQSTKKSLKRVSRIAQAATVYVSAAYGGIPAREVEKAKLNLERYRSNLTGKSPKPDEATLGMARAVAWCALSSPRRSKLEPRLRERLTQGH
jgi:hypothetical protein